jgi:hypothetical protein
MPAAFNKNKFKAPFILLIVSFVIVTGVFLFLNRYLSKNVSTTRQNSQNATPVNTSGWLKYLNQRYSYSFEYPSNLILDALSEGDNPFTPEEEVGDEGTFLIDTNVSQGELERSMVVNAFFIPANLSGKSLSEIVGNYGSLIDACNKNVPQRTENVLTESGIQGIKVWYLLAEGCQGAGANEVNDPYVFFDARPRNNVLITFFENQMHEEFDGIVSTFNFEEPQDYGD